MPKLAENKPASENTGDDTEHINPFNDVASTNWFYDSVLYVYEQGLMTGTGADTFDPDGGVTRQQLAVLLYNYAKYMGYDVSASEDTNLPSYGDASDISYYAFTALQWACGVGILQGDTERNLKPQGSTTRAEIAVIIERLAELRIK